jgi:hypothetical protein
MPATYTTSGAIADITPSQATGALSTGIGVSALTSGPNRIQTPTLSDFVADRIGGAVGNGLGFPTFVAGSGYTNGTYVLNAANGGLTGGGGDSGELTVTVVGGAITQPVVTGGGRNYATVPVAVLTSLGAGVGGSITNALVADGRVVALGVGYGANKGQRYLMTTGPIGNNLAIPGGGGYINRSGRALATGDFVWAVAP